MTQARLRPALTFPADLVLVVLFALIGRKSHDHGLSLGGVLAVAFPFALGVVAGWGLIRSRIQRWPDRVLHGVTLAVVTVAIGMLGRALTGQELGTGLAGFASFVGVALGWFLITFVGYRAAATRFERARR